MDEVVQGTLDWCNEIRARNEREPLTDLPKGKLSDPDTCPCGAATGTYVGVGSFYKLFANGSVDYFSREYLPDDVREFVQRFDNGHYPQYQADS